MDIFSELNEKQAEAVKYLTGPLLVLAGAGSGKTRVITYRIAYLLMSRVNARNILAVTFTNKAAGEMKNRIERLVGLYPGLTVGTFHSVCVRILRKEIGVLGFRPDFVIYDQDDSLMLVKTCMKELQIDDKKFRVQSVKEKISNAKNELYSPEQFADRIGDYFDKTVSNIYTLYNKKLMANNALDFDDLIMHTVRIFRENNDILSSYQEKFKHILVDEYQDTNHSQYLLVHLLARKHSSVCVVGDPDQSIYRWRGADYKNIFNFENDYSEVKNITLDRNYRSTGNILNAANKLIENNRGRKEKALWTDKGPGDLLVRYTARTEAEEVDFVVRGIAWAKETLNMEYSQMVVFYRMHAQSRLFEEGLRRLRIPYDIVGGISFYRRKEIKDILAYLKFIEFPDDELSLRRIINVPARGIGGGTVIGLEQLARKKGISLGWAFGVMNESEDISERAKKNLEQFYHLIEDLRAEKDSKSLGLLIRDIIDRTSYFQELKKEDKIQAQVRIENVKELVSAAEEFSDRTDGGTLMDFLENAALISGVDQWQSEDDKVTLMTLHCAKGLEFPLVFMVGMEEGIFPHSSSLSDPEELDEERRLCYVGMTRAMERLFLCSAESRLLYGKRNYAIPSRFLSELVPECVKDVDRFSSWRLFSKREIDDSASEKSKKVFDGYYVGQKVKHFMFGEGEILEVIGDGGAQKLSVIFEKRRETKLLSAAYAKLAVID
ncbi:MAG: UvrD-helicase domain-containing protein [Candidatus Theseobacter exili]|nr:UvrD-helicase domain-containing protein [Candidatus Theseobacter exili]